MSKLTVAPLVGVMLLCALGLVSRAHAETVQASELRGAGGEPLCIDVADGRAESGADLILFPCHGGANQSFTYFPSTGELRSSLGNLCIDVSYGRAFSGSRVQLWECNGLGAQNFDYDPRSGHLSFRAAPSLCLDLGGSGGASLRNCAERRGQRFDLRTRYGKARFDELTFVAAHNAFANNEDSGFIAVNQSYTISHLLEDGVRGLMLDAHSFESGTARCIASFGSDCYPRDVYMCHGDCAGVPGVGYGLPRRTIADALRAIVSFLRSHPEEIVTVLLEDLVNHDELRKSLDSVSGLRDLMFDPYAWNVQKNGWPRASALVYANDRLLILSDRSDKQDLGVGYARDFTVENYWSLGSTSPDYSCKTRWSNITLDRTEPAFHRLFVMNHFRDVALPAYARADNARAVLYQRMNEQCVPAARRKPNFIAVDFYENGDARAVAAEVSEVAAILYEHSDFGGRAQLLRPGSYSGAALALGNDQASSLQVLPGARLTMFEHADYQGRGRTFTVSASGLGPDFNDLASSVQVFRDPADTAQHQRLDGDFDGDGRQDLLVYYGGTGDFLLGRSDGVVLAWSVAGNVAGFGNLLDGRHAMFSGDFSGDGKSDVLMYFSGDGNLWLGRSGGSALAWSFAGNVAALGNLLGRANTMHTGDYDGNGMLDLAAYDRESGDLWLGLSSGSGLAFARAANLSAWGDLGDDAHELFHGDFDGNGKSDLAFYAADTGELWLGLSSGGALTFSLAARVPGFGDLMDAEHRCFVGDFDGNGKSDLAFYYSGNGDLWFGLSDGRSLSFASAGNVAGFGNLLDPSRMLHTGDFNGDGRSDLMFHFNGDGNTWFGLSNGSSLAWNWAGTMGDAGDMLDDGRLMTTGDYNGDGKTDLLSYSSSEDLFRLGRSTGKSIEWVDSGRSTLFSDLFR